jgi:hypothetical protein
MEGKGWTKSGPGLNRLWVEIKRPSGIWFALMSDQYTT